MKYYEFLSSLKETISGIYAIKNLINNKIYIGKSNNIKRRMIEHKKKSNIKQKKIPLYSAIQKYGWENFDIEILDILPNQILLEKESEWIQKLQTNKKEFGYNILQFGSQRSLDYKVSLETREKISNSLKGKLAGKKNPMFGKSGKDSPNFGKKQTNETKTKRKKTWERLKKTGWINPLKGKKRTEQTKQKISLGLRKEFPQDINRKYPKKIVKSGRPNKKVKQINLNTKEVIKIWDSLIEAAHSFNRKNSSHIVDVCKKKKNSYLGFGWEYV